MIFEAFMRDGEVEVKDKKGNILPHQPETKEEPVSQVLRGTIIFTVVELFILVVWGVILDLGRGLPFRTQVIAAAVLAGGLFLEHLISINVGRKRPLLDTKD